MNKLKDMREQVKAELEHIPRGEMPQNELRQAYWILRMNSLGKKAIEPSSKEDVLKECIELLRKDNLNFEFRYDKEFFEIHND